jgi:hypothetical protein
VKSWTITDCRLRLVHISLRFAAAAAWAKAWGCCQCWTPPHQ